MQSETDVLRGRQASYQLGAPIGEGGFGVTHHATRLEDGAELVVKQLRMDRVDDWKAVELFEREASVLEGLDHPGVPRFVDHFPLGDGDVPEGYVIVQEYIPGRTLETIRRNGGGLDREHMQRWFLRLLEVCQFLHERRPPIVHRDISPKNVIIRPDGEPVLIDFGMVQAALPSAGGGSTSAGTFGYAPMEQFVGRAVPSSDLYGLAMTWIAVATGHEPEQLPFRGNRIDIRAALADHDVDARLLLALESMTEPDVERRNVTAELMLQRLAPLRAGGGRASGGPASRDGFVAQTSQPVDEADMEGPTTHLSLDEIAQIEADSATAVRAEVTGGEQLRTRAATGAPSTDALVEEELTRWRDAKARAERLGDAAWPAPPQFSAYSLDGCAVSADGRRAIIHADGAFLADLQNMTARPLRLDEWDMHDYVGAISPDGRAALSIASADTAMILFDIAADGSFTEREVSVSDGYHQAAQLAISPDGSLVAIGTSEGVDGMIELVDWTSGAVEQRLEADSGHGLCFSADGRYLVALGYMETRVFAMDGSEGRIEAERIAFAPDGRTVALIERSPNSGHIIHVGTMQSLLPLEWAEHHEFQPIPRHDPLRVLDVDIEHLTFSPDARLLAADVTSTHQPDPKNRPGHVEIRRAIYVASVPSGEIVARVGTFEEHGHSVENVAGLGFTSDSDTLLVTGDIRLPLAEVSDASGILAYSLSQQRPLGLIHQMSLDDDVAQRTARDGWPPEHSTLFARSPEGICGRWTVPAPENGEHPEVPFERPRLMSDILSGIPPEQLVDDPVDADAICDLRLRIDALNELRTLGHIAKEGSLRAAVDATRGVTHLLPWIVQQSAGGGGGGPRFGQQSAVQCASPGAVASMAERAKSRSSGEQDVYFEDGLEFAKQIALEREERRQAEEQERERARSAASRRRILGVGLIAAAAVLFVLSITVFPPAMLVLGAVAAVMILMAGIVFGFMKTA